MKQKKKKDFEKEYYFEINDADCKIDTLKAYGTKEDTLAYEVYLREIYGDVIGIDSDDDDYDAGAKKQVLKLSDVEKNKNKAYLHVCDEIDESDFDKKLETLNF